MDKGTKMSKSKEYKNYHEKKKRKRKDGTIDAGEGKRRPHHKDALKGVKKSSKLETRKHREAVARIGYIPRTANKYQTTPKKVGETKSTHTYEWLEDNGHKDHVQVRRKEVLKDEDRMPIQLSPPSKEYKENYNEIFDKKKRGVNVEGGYKKFKKTY